MLNERNLLCRLFDKPKSSHMSTFDMSCSPLPPPSISSSVHLDFHFRSPPPPPTSSRGVPPSSSERLFNISGAHAGFLFHPSTLAPPSGRFSQLWAECLQAPAASGSGIKAASYLSISAHYRSILIEKASAHMG